MPGHASSPLRPPPVLVRFAHLIALAAAIAAAAELVRIGARAVGINLAFRYHNEPGVLMVYGLGVLGVLAFARLVWGVSLVGAVATAWRHRRRVLRGFLLAAALAVVAVLVAGAVAASTGALAWHTTRLERWGWMLTMRTVSALASLVVVAVVEETMFRGIAFGYLRAAPRASAAGAALGSAVIFALAHRLDEPSYWLGPNGPALFVGLALLGVLLAVTYDATGSLACATGLHAGLLLVEVFARNRGTRVVLVSPSAWMGADGDLRTAPLAWILFVALTLVVWRAGPAFRARVAVPPDAAAPLTVPPNMRTNSGAHRHQEGTYPRRQERGD
jgi:membrane protease YdiL (CAAX protease family)